MDESPEAMDGDPNMSCIQASYTYVSTVNIREQYIIHSFDIPLEENEPVIQYGNNGLFIASSLPDCTHN